MKLDTRVEKALQDINFVERYEALSHTFSRSRTPKEEALDYYDGDFLMDIINSLGYEVKFSKKEVEALAGVEDEYNAIGYKKLQNEVENLRKENKHLKNEIRKITSQMLVITGELE